MDKNTEDPGTTTVAPPTIMEQVRQQEDDQAAASAKAAEQPRDADGKFIAGDGEEEETTPPGDEGAGEPEGEEAAGDTDSEGTEKPKPGSSVSKRVTKLGQKASYWQKVAKGGTPTQDETEAAGETWPAPPPIPAPTPPPPPPPVDPPDPEAPPYTGEIEGDTRPTREEFADPEDYTVELQAWVTRREIRKGDHARAQAQQATAQEQAEAARSAGFMSTVEAAKARHADFDTVFAAVPAGMGEVLQQGGPARPAREAIEESEFGGDVLYHLAGHPEELAALAGATPAAQVRAIVAIEGAVRAEIEAGGGESPPAPEKPPANVSAAPPPPETVSGAGRGATTSGEMTDSKIRQTLDKAGISTPKTRMG